MRTLLVALALAWAAPAAAQDVVVLLDSGETVEGELVKYKLDKFYMVRGADGKAVKLKWDAVVDVRSKDPAVTLDFGGGDLAGTGLPEDAKRSKSPLKDVEALANRYEQDLQKRLAEFKREDSYWMVRTDVGALAASALPPEAEIVEADVEHIATDYLWSTSEGIEEGVGEWHEQRRERLVIEVSPGPFVSVSPKREVGVRRYYGGKGEPIWKTEAEPLELNLEGELARLEQETIDMTAVILAPTEAKRLMKAAAPEGFELEATADQIIARRRVSEARGNPKTGEWARWERMHVVTFSLTGEGSEKRVSVLATEQERVVTNEREPEFSDSLTVDPRPATLMLRGLLKAAGVRARMPGSLLQPVGIIARPGSPEPSVPPLRTWAEVREDQEQESIQTLTGVWRLQQPHVQVPASRSDRSPFDEPTEEDGPEPDLSMRVDINGTIGDLETAQDKLDHTWRWQTDAVFRNGRPEIIVTVADIDLDNRETIAFCELKIADLLAREWQKCGVAKVKFDLEWVDPAPPDEFELPD
ncbi:MAG: hypothetical protein EP330_23575 [Deltaproteobacteria bacterium]|nr:MAG: hypothetical protein EP330_23575 [Deltaproteobacteria bacterium]